MANYSKMTVSSFSSHNKTVLDRAEVEGWLSNYIYRNTPPIAKRDLSTPGFAPDPITIAVLDLTTMRITLFRKSELIDIQLCSLAAINPVSHVVHRYLSSMHNVAGVKAAILIMQKEPGAYLAFRPLPVRPAKESWPSHVEVELLRGVFSGPVPGIICTDPTEGPTLTPDVITISDGSWKSNPDMYTAHVCVYDVADNAMYYLEASHDTRPSRYGRKERKDMGQ